ncbi:MAG TPA: TraR/DksA C4-type zinc finger protein [Blastocatellia bacterium]|nr:TraR/DksA C4-type zinc finger protein [Blastocatellia bacterium]
MALDLDGFRKRLIEERDRLNREIPSVSELAEPASDDRQITAANAPLIGEIKDVQTDMADRKTHRLRQVQAALQSMDDGTYGICVRCNQPIDPRRLEADPAAMTCMSCLSAEEQNFETATM